MKIFSKWTTSIQPKLLHSFVTIFLLVALVAALEFGLRINQQNQFQSTNLSKPPKDKIVLVSLGDSVSAGYPPLLEHILNSPNQSKFVVQNQYKTVFKSGTLQRTIESLTLDDKPAVILLMLGQFSPHGLRANDSSKFDMNTKNSVISKIVALKLFDWADSLKRSLHLVAFLDKEAAEKKLDQLYLELGRGLYLTEYSQSEIRTAESILQALEFSLPKNPKVLMSKYYLSLISQEKDQAQTQLNLIKSAKWDTSSTKELNAFFQLEFGASPLSGFNLLSDLLKSGDISSIGCLVLHARQFDSGQVADSIKTIEACHTLHPKDGFILFKLFESKRLNGQRDEALRLASELEQFDWAPEKLSRILLKQYYYLAIDFSNDKRPRSQEIANELMTRTIYHATKLILIEKADESTIRTYFWAQRFLINRGVTFHLEPGVAEKVEKHSRFGVYAAMFEKFQGQESEPKKQEFANRIFTQGELISDAKEGEQTLDLPFGLLKALEAQCSSQVTLVLMQYPNQSPDQLLRAKNSIKCMRFIDTREIMRDSIRQKEHSLNELFQEDGLHLTELGNELLARRICMLLREEAPGTFAAVDCQRTL